QRSAALLSYERAQQLYQQLKDRDPNNPEYYIKVGQTLIKKGELANQLRDYAAADENFIAAGLELAQAPAGAQLLLDWHINRALTHFYRGNVFNDRTP